MSERIRKKEMIIFAACAVIMIILCVLGVKFISPISGSAAAEITLPVSHAYRIVYNPVDGEWAADAAEYLAEALYEKTGIRPEVYSQNSVDSLESGREILIGNTDRDPGTYEDNLALVGINGCLIKTGNDGENVYLCSFSEKGAMTAIDILVESRIKRYSQGDPESLEFITDGGTLMCVGKSADPEDAASGYDLLACPQTLSFDKDGKFTILILSDTCDEGDPNEYTVAAIKAMVAAHNPDLVLFCGNFRYKNDTVDDFAKYMTALTEPIVSAGVPWAAVFGNTDAASGLSRKNMMSALASLPYFSGRSGPENISGVSNFFIPVYSSDMKSLAFGIWGLDCTDPASEVNSVVASDGSYVADVNKAGGEFGTIAPDQVAWYYNSSKRLELQYGRKISSLMIVSNPVNEFSQINDAARQSGQMTESASASPVNSGLVSAAVLRGDIRGIYCGNNHLNTYSGRYCGIELGFTASVGYNGYGLGGTFDTNNSLRGGRVVVISESDPSAVTSYMIYAKDLGVTRN